MTAIFMLCTLIIFLTVDYIVARKKEAATPRLSRHEETAFPLFFPPDVQLATNHVWMRPSDGDVVTLGIDEFLARASGKPDVISFPAIGSVTGPAIPAIGLRLQDNRLDLETPVTGEITEINEEVLKNPELLSRDAYGKGWLIKIRRFPGKDSSDRFVVRNAQRWLHDQYQGAVDLFHRQFGNYGIVTLQDGGMLREGLLRDSGPDVWEEFRSTFSALTRTDAGDHRSEGE